MLGGGRYRHETAGDDEVGEGRVGAQQCGVVTLANEDGGHVTSQAFDLPPRRVLYSSRRETNKVTYDAS